MYLFNYHHKKDYKYRDLTRQILSIPNFLTLISWIGISKSTDVIILDIYTLNVTCVIREGGLQFIRVICPRIFLAMTPLIAGLLPICLSRA